MLDRRAWIITALILTLAAGAYVIWITRPRAVYTARSLSASGKPANSPSKPVTTSLHIEGCKDDFIVSPGELIEPQVVPGSSLEQARSKYGPETRREKSGVLYWDKWEYSLIDGYFGPENPQNFLHVSLNGGHVIETLDGIELGLDSFGTIFRKMRDKKVEVQERLAHAENGWTLTLSLYSSCGHNFRGEYSRTLPDDPELDRQIAATPAAPNGAPSPLHSDAFMNKVVYEYKLVPSNGQNDSSAGTPSEHD